MRRVLHIEVGGSYGGSIKGLELYLRRADRERFDNQVLLYYRTPGSDLFNGMAQTSILLDHSPRAGRTNPAIRALRPLIRRQLIMDVLSFVRAWPLIPKLTRFMRSERFDVVHVNNTFTYQPASILAASAAGIPIVAHVRNPVRWSALSKALARRVRRFVTVNQTLADSLRRYPAQHIREAIKPSDAKPDAVEHMRATLGGGRNLIVGSVGRLDLQKGYEYLIRAAHLVCRDRSDVSFFVAGDGPLRPRLQRLIDSLGLNGRFYLMGFRDDVEVITAALDLYACSSLWEGSPLTVLDAIALGVPVVSTKVGVVAEVIDHGQTGWLVEPKNVESLASAIIDGLGISPEVRHQMALAGKSSVAPFLDTSGLARQFESVLDSV